VLRYEAWDPKSARVWQNARHSGPGGMSGGGALSQAILAPRCCAGLPSDGWWLPARLGGGWTTVCAATGLGARRSSGDQWPQRLPGGDPARDPLDLPFDGWLSEAGPGMVFNLLRLVRRVASRPDCAPGSRSATFSALTVCANVVVQHPRRFHSRIPAGQALPAVPGWVAAARAMVRCRNG